MYKQVDLLIDNIKPALDRLLLEYFWPFGCLNAVRYMYQKKIKTYHTGNTQDRNNIIIVIENKCINK